MKFKLLILNDCKELFFKVNEFIKKYPNFNYTLNQHLIKTVISVGSNISEGNERKSDIEFARFLNIALSSISELEFQLSLYDDDDIEILNLIKKIRATTINLIKNKGS